MAPQPRDESGKEVCPDWIKNCCRKPTCDLSHQKVANQPCPKYMKGCSLECKYLIHPEVKKRKAPVEVTALYFRGVQKREVEGEVISQDAQNLPAQPPALLLQANSSQGHTSAMADSSEAPVTPAEAATSQPQPSSTVGRVQTFGAPHLPETPTLTAIETSAVGASHQPETSTEITIPEDTSDSQSSTILSDGSTIKASHQSGTSTLTTVPAGTSNLQSSSSTASLHTRAKEVSTSHLCFLYENYLALAKFSQPPTSAAPHGEHTHTSFTDILVEHPWTLWARALGMEEEIQEPPHTRTEEPQKLDEGEWPPLPRKP